MPNPFSTRFVCPGAMAYQRSDGGSIERLADNFFDLHRRRASIVGPHGSGKSTLIATLKENLAKRSKVFAHRFSASDRTFQNLWRQAHQWDKESVVIVDGYEQLTFWSRWRLRSKAWRRQAGLLITAHRECSTFPVLWRTDIDETKAKTLRDELLASRLDLQQANNIEDAWIAARRKFPTDLRETWMSMYDWAEEQKQKQNTFPANRHLV